MFLLVKDRKNSKKNTTDNKDIIISKKDKKIALIIVLSTMFIYYIIGYIFKTDILNPITLIITVLIIGKIIDFISKSKEMKQNQ